MPKFPHFSQKISQIKSAVFEKYRSKIVTFGPDMVRLHIGDTYKQPLYNIPLSEEFKRSNYNFNRYCNTFGITELREALAEKLDADNNLNVDIDNILITAGATNALSAALHTILGEKDEMLVFTPCWPIFPGLVNSVPAKIIEVPLYSLLEEKPDLVIGEYLRNYITPRTAAIYMNSPNNPSGKVLNMDQLRQIGRFASDDSLWILSDEAYDGLTFDDNQHICIASRPDFFERTISVFTFSKLFMFAGLRLGYAVAAEGIIQNMNKTMVHQIYSPSTFAQQMMVDPVKNRYDWMGEVRDQYQDLRDIFFENIGFVQKSPEAGYFMFFSIEPYLGEKSFSQIIDGCLEKGVSIAPGVDFGRGFEKYIRVCFTGEPPERLIRGAKILREILTI